MNLIPFSPVITSMMRTSMMRTSMMRTLKISALLGICLFVSFSISIIPESLACRWNNKMIKESINNGDLIILKIKLFYEKNGRYPRQLTELFPEYIDALPLPSAGAKQWNYGAEKGDEFRLGFSMPRDSTWHGYPSCQYDSRFGKWLVDQ